MKILKITNSAFANKKFSTASVLLFFMFMLMANLPSLAQNWNVFNPAYRYNYKFENSVLVSQVLFADSSEVIATDTVYYLNRIGVECTGPCPTLTTAISPTTQVMVGNMPQFLQRHIRKNTNGLVILKDTAELFIQGNCQPGQSWIFDSINSKTALCMNKQSQVVFGLNDSIKLILIGGVDTLKLSKNFGILQFPDLYLKNKYYRLVGIEKANSYDQTALFGLKVPNAWDFYNYDVGDKFCYMWDKSSLSSFETCYSGDYTILSKTLDPNVGYKYKINHFVQSCNTFTYSYPPSDSLYYISNSSPGIHENNMYPGQIYMSPHETQIAANIVHFGIDNQGRFYKFAGKSCVSNNAQVTFPFNSNSVQAIYFESFNEIYYSDTYIFNGPYEVSLIYGVGLGKLSDTYRKSVGYHEILCSTCAVKNNQLLYGTETYLSLNEKNNLSYALNLFPNPNDGKLYLKMDGQSISEIKIINTLGQVIQTVRTNGREDKIEIDLTDQHPGIYFVQAFDKDKLIGSQKFIKN